MEQGMETMHYLLIIPGKLPGLNDYIAAERTNRYKGAQMKAENEQIVMLSIRKSLKGAKISKPVYMEYTWFEKDRRRDLDNISSFGRKVIQDALVKSGVLYDDGWNEITGFLDRFQVDSKNPRIVFIREV